MRIVNIKTGPVSIPAGVHVTPTSDQLRRRTHQMRSVGENVYMTIEQTHWKTGEQVLTDWAIDKSMINHVEFADAEVEEQEAAPQQEYDIEALASLKVKDLLEIIPDLSSEELELLAETDNRVTVKEAIKESQAKLVTDPYKAEIEQRAKSSEGFGAA